MMSEDESYDHMDGPEQVIPVNNLITSKPKGAVKLRMDSSGYASQPPISVPGVMTKIAKQYPNNPALKTRDPKTNAEQVWTWKQYRDEVRTVAKAFIELGLDRLSTVCILGFNSPEWVISDVAAIHAGGMAAGIYPTNNTEACRYILENSSCNILVVEDHKQLQKVWDLRNELPALKKIVQYSGTPSHPGVMSWRDLLTLGRSLPDTDLENRLRRIAINQGCTLVYTSGTTGNPKGVMLSHDNLTWVSWMETEIHSWIKGGTRTLSYLPLSHIAANMLDIHGPMAIGGCTYFADKDVLKTTLKDNLNWCKPTEFLGVPRVYEKIMEKLKEIGKSTKGMKKKISTAAKATALEYHLKGTSEQKYGIFKKVVYSKIKDALGFSECRHFYTGAAPMDNSCWRYFLSLDIKILEIYGMSECTGPHTNQTYESFKEGSCGQNLPTVKSRLVESKDPDISGKELWMWGRHVMMGYMNREDATKKDMTEDGWLKSGDLAEIDGDGFHYIVGREKDLIITAGGENVAPAPIQEIVKEELPIVSQVLVIGDKKKFLSCFLTLAVNVDPDTLEPSKELSPLAKDWCRSIGSNANNIDDILRRPDSRVMREIQKGIDRSNKKAVSNAQRLQKWMILPVDFSIPGGELGPTLKVKRAAIVKRYDHCIDRIYQEAIANGRRK